jgi:radical SAM protein with 4Fe4S-binding SPASM domain
MQNKGDHKGELIDFELFKKIIDRITEQRVINNRQGILLDLVFHGGEVLLLGKKRLYEILEYATKTFQQNSISYNLACQTNATLLNDEITKILSKFQVGVGLSFDGIEGSNSSRTAIKQEIFENKFEMLKENNARYGFLIVASKTNIDNMQKTQEYLENLGVEESGGETIVKGYKINYSEDMLNPGPDSEIELSGQEMFDRVWKPELNRFLERGKTIEYHTAEMLEKVMIDILSEHTWRDKSGCSTKWCGAGITMIAIEPDGEMDYCDRYARKYPEIYVQHALDYDFLGIYQLKKVVEYNMMKSELYKEYECDTCYADFICDHGCEAFYKSKYGKYGIDTRLVCDQHREFYSYILRHLKEFLIVYAEKGIELKTMEPYSIQKLKQTVINNEFELTLNKNGDRITVRKI